MAPIVIILVGVLAAVLGFAAHRASVCTVRAVAEVLSSRTAHMLACIGKSALWVIAITMPMFLLMPAAGAGLNGWPLTGAAVIGGGVFGLGAAINGGCAFSTLARLVDGEGGMLAASLAFALGVFCFVALADAHWLARPAPAPALLGSLIGWALVPALALAAWSLFEAVQVWRERPSGVRWHGLMLAPQYRLSSAAMLIGLASAAIFLLYGSASYTVTVEQAVEAVRGTHAFPAAMRWLLLAAVLAGMLVSTLQRGTFRLDWRPRRIWLRHVCGGLLMGFGVALAPGGNDALVLYGIPTFSPHALPAFLALLLGVAAGLLVMRAVFGIELRVACRNDLYVGDAAVPAGAASSQSHAGFG